MLYLHSYNRYFQQHKLTIKLNIDHLSYREDCQRTRPDWVPEDGVVTSVSEFLILLNTPIWIRMDRNPSSLLVEKERFKWHFSNALFNGNTDKLEYPIQSE